MTSPICLGCDYYRPLHYNVIGRECATFFTCTESNRCGLRSPPLTDAERKAHYGEENNGKEQSVHDYVDQEIPETICTDNNENVNVIEETLQAHEQG